MKFMDQSLFEVCVLTLAGWKAESNEAFEEMKRGLYDVYQPSFPGDNLWWQQITRSADDAVAIAQTIAAGKESRLLLLAAEIRKQLDDDLAPTSGMMSKLGLKGSFFTKSPTPHLHQDPRSQPVT